MNITETRTETIINLLNNKHITGQCSEYGELGYDKPEKGILFANWNDISDPIKNYLEKAGFALEWSDEWEISYDWNKAYRTSPSSYDWECLIAYNDNGELLTPEDELSDWIEYAEYTDHTRQPRSLRSDFARGEKLTELNNLGYNKINGDSYESGLHDGMNDDPLKIGAVLCKLGYDSILFIINDTSQFYITFDVYAKKEEIE